MAEVGRAVANQHIGIDEANSLVTKLLDKYEHVFSQPAGNPGKPFDQVYDVESLQPVREWHRMYEEVKQEVCAFGLDSLAMLPRIG